MTGARDHARAAKWLVGASERAVRPIALRAAICAHLNSRGRSPLMVCNGTHRDWSVREAIWHARQALTEIWDATEWRAA